MSGLIRAGSFWVVVAVLLGLAAGSFAFDAVPARPSIGIVRVNADLYPFTVPDIVRMLEYAEDTASMKAIVMEVDCPGGDSVSTEELYFRLASLRDKKPVVAYINTIGASGGYYISVATNFIYAKPSSNVGSVGAYTSMPDREEVEEDIIWTGPYKATGSSRREAMNRLETLKEVFVQTVVSERGQRLKISKEEVSKAGVYSGLEALKYGLIDDIGSGADAFTKAADLAGVKNYKVVDIAQELGIRLRPWWYAYTGLMSTDNLSLNKSSAPVFYYLYRSPEAQE